LVSQTAAHWLSVRSTAPSQPRLSLLSRPGDGGGLRSGVVSLLFRFVTHSSHSYSAQITAHCQFFPAQVVARWLEKHSSVNVDFVVIAQVGSTHRFSTAPESRRTVISIPPRWRQHSGHAFSAYGTPMSRHAVISIPPRWRQHSGHSVLLHMARLCHGQHRSASTVRLMATWFRDNEALWRGQPQSVTPDHRLIVFHLTGCY
jgi:hypothetical protein